VNKIGCSPFAVVGIGSSSSKILKFARLFEVLVFSKQKGSVSRTLRPNRPPCIKDKMTKTVKSPDLLFEQNKKGRPKAPLALRRLGGPRSFMHLFVDFPPAGMGGRPTTYLAVGPENEPRQRFYEWVQPRERT
jgi:hypothetical protein